MLNTLAHSRCVPRSGKSIVPEHRRAQGPSKDVSNLGFLAYNSEPLDNECIFITCTLGAFKCTALIDFGCFVYACIGDTFAQVFPQKLFPKP